MHGIEEENRMKEMKGVDEVKRNSDDGVNRGAGGDQ